MSVARATYERFGQPMYEFAKFGVIGVAGLFITNAVYDLFFLHLGAGPVTSTTIATIVAAICTYLGNRYWSFRTRQRTGVVRELVIFAVLNGIGLLIQDAAVAVNYYLLHLGHNKLAGFAALNLGIALATLFRFWSYRRFVWIASPASAAGHTGGQPPRRQLPRTVIKSAGTDDGHHDGPGRACPPRGGGGNGTEVCPTGRPASWAWHRARDGRGGRRGAGRAGAV
jgi:putative flippase GtrA